MSRCALRRDCNVICMSEEAYNVCRRCLRQSFECAGRRVVTYGGGTLYRLAYIIYYMQAGAKKQQAMNDVGIGYRVSGKRSGSGRTFTKITPAGTINMRVDEVNLRSGRGAICVADVFAAAQTGACRRQSRKVCSSHGWGWGIDPDRVGKASRGG